MQWKEDFHGWKFPGGQTERGYQIRLALQVMKVKVAASNMLFKVEVALKLFNA